MNASNQSPELKASQHSAPPAIHSQTMSRVISVVKGFTGYAGLVSLGVLACEATLPAEYTPSEIIGRFHGRVENADALAKMEAVPLLNRKNAEATSQPPAVAAMETEAFRQQQQMLANSLQSQSVIANTADGACAAAKIISPGDRDWGWLRTILNSGCGVGDQVRQDMMTTLRRGGQDNSVLIQRPRAGGN